MRTRLAPALALAAATLVPASFVSGCYGSFAATKKIYKWNGTVGDKWVNSVVMVALSIIPVYGIATFADAVVLNAVEFWTGKNPLAMRPGESETRIVRVDGNELEITATRNRLDIVAAGGAAATLTYDADARAWYVDTPEGPRMVAREDGDVLALYHADGTRQLVAR